MSVMVTRARLSPSKFQGPEVIFAPDALSDFDRMKFVLEQVIYFDYLDRTCNSCNLLNDFIKNIKYDFSHLKKEIFNKDLNICALYEIGYNTIEQMIKTSGCSIVASLNDLVAIFSRSLTDKYAENIYHTSMNKKFLEEWYAIATGKYDDTEHPNGFFVDAMLFVPSVEFRNSTLCIVLEAKTVEGMDCKQLRKGNACLPCILRAFDFRNMTIDELIAIIASFSIDHSKYIMNNYDTISIVDICFDVLTGSSYTDGPSGADRVSDLEAWMNFFKDHVSSKKLKTSQDNELFGELLSKAGQNSAIVNYFVKPLNQITATEALSFRNSLFSDFISDRLAPGMEDDTNPSQNDSNGDSGVGETPNLPDRNTENSNQENDQAVEGATDGDLVDNDENEEKIVKPQIDPSKMLLELAKSAETMSDYIYRETVSRRISSILKNPPVNAMPNDLLMLKRWRSRWLYLASISCLRDFLTRVSLRLSNV